MSRVITPPVGVIYNRIYSLYLVQITISHFFCSVLVTVFWGGTRHSRGMKYRYVFCASEVSYCEHVSEKNDTVTKVM